VGGCGWVCAALQLGRAARSLTLTAGRSHRPRDMARAGPVRTTAAADGAAPADLVTTPPRPEKIPGDHMANATTGLPPGVKTMVLERFEMGSGRVLKDVRASPLPRVQKVPSLGACVVS
jgi:hypothetical protein